MNKKLVIMVGVVCCVFASAFARGCGYRPCHPSRPMPPAVNCCRPMPTPCHYNCNRNNDMWGKGGRNFWPGFIGGVVSGILTSR